MSFDVSEVEGMIARHMKNQPYEVTCSECGAAVEVVGSMYDNDYDLRLKVFPCDCQKAKVDDAV